MLEGIESCTGRLAIGVPFGGATEGGGVRVFEEEEEFEEDGSEGGRGGCAATSFPGGIRIAGITGLAGFFPVTGGIGCEEGW